jgi:ABC-type molybdenum transport system ATPase subunit/photorepair protein PhrA
MVNQSIRQLICALTNRYLGSGKTTLISLITSDHPQTYSLPILLFGKSRLPEPGKPGISIFDIQSRIGHSSPEVHVFFPKNLTVRRAIESAWSDTPLTKPRLTHEADEKVAAALRWFQAELHPSLGPTRLQKDEMMRKTRFDEPFASARQGKESNLQENVRKEILEEEMNEEGLEWADQLHFRDLSFSAQRVLLFIRAVIRNPDLVILDEAFSGMDDFARDKCHLFLSRGETAIFKWRTLRPDKKIRQKGPRPYESDISRLGRVRIHGLTKEQALIVVSHKKEEVPGCVRDWICLPEAGTGTPPRTGHLSTPLELGVNGWREIWGEDLLYFNREEVFLSLSNRGLKQRLTDQFDEEEKSNQQS